jgi:thiosulfate/3-mercaptopyruvate sulfurtransferase
MNDDAPPPLVTTDWLAARMEVGNVRVLDASWYLPAQNRDAKAEYAAAHIRGAAFFDIDAIADRTSSLPHMLPTPQDFGKAVGALGVSNADTVVIYDGAGIFSAPRAWWTFRVFGHDNVAVLDGGLPKWLREGRPMESGPAKCRTVPFTASYRPELVRDFAAVSENLRSHIAQVLDARSEGRFKGTEPEPRPGLKGGHIPGSRNLPFQALIDPKTGTMKPREELAEIFVAAGISPNSQVITSCGSGLTAAILAYGLFLIGHIDAAVYDGSWSEWGGRDDAPVDR